MYGTEIGYDVFRGAIWKKSTLLREEDVVFQECPAEVFVEKSREYFLWILGHRDGSAAIFDVGGICHIFFDEELEGGVAHVSICLCVFGVFEDVFVESCQMLAQGVW